MIDAKSREVVGEGAGFMLSATQWADGARERETNMVLSFRHNFQQSCTKNVSFRRLNRHEREQNIAA